MARLHRRQAHHKYILALLCACGGGGLRTAASVEALKQPWYAYLDRGVDTSQTIALDGDGEVWLASSTPVRSEPLTATRTASQAQRKAVTDAFAALPATPETCGTFSSVESKVSGVEQTWQICASGQGQLAATAMQGL